MVGRPSICVDSKGNVGASVAAVRTVCDDRACLLLLLKFLCGKLEDGRERRVLRNLNPEQRKRRAQRTIRVSTATIATQSEACKSTRATHTRYGSLGSEVRVILNCTLFSLALLQAQV